MGGAVSTGQNNDDLIDNLIRADYIRTRKVEKVFRAIDRADYFLPDARQNAYKDLAWKMGHLHLSAPCIYSEVMEGLCLEPGLSFLNLGSGTGYLSTMAGLILGSHGINHGVEIHEDVIVYANKKLEDFKKFSGAIDEFDFCEPKFIQGNCLCLANGRQYDRVYCGASCPEQYESYMKSLLRVGGILIMPLNDHLMEIKRVSQMEWIDRTLIPVSFATLILPPEGNQDIVELLEVSPSSLQFLTRTVIRSILRTNIEIENPSLTAPKPKVVPLAKYKRRDRTLKKLIVPIFDETDEDLYSSGDDQYSSDDGLGRNTHSSRPRTADNIIDIVMDHLGYRVHRVNRPQNADDSDVSVEEIGLRMADSAEVVSSDVDEDLENVFDNRDEDDSPKCENVHESERKLETENAEDDGNNENEEFNDNNHPGTSFNTKSNTKLNTKSGEKETKKDTKDTKKDAKRDGKKQSKKQPREKYDSGFVEEMDQEGVASKQESMDLSDADSMGVASSSSSEGRQGKRYKRCLRLHPDSSGPKNRKVLPAMVFDNSSGSSCLSSDSEVAEEKSTPPTAISLTVTSMYTPLMREKLQELPLPSVLKNYLNYYREF